MRTERISRGPSTWRVLKAFEAARFSRASLHPISARTLSLSLYIYIYTQTNKHPCGPDPSGALPAVRGASGGPAACARVQHPCHLSVRGTASLPPPPLPSLPPSQSPSLPSRARSVPRVPARGAGFTLLGQFAGQKRRAWAARPGQGQAGGWGVDRYERRDDDDGDNNSAKDNDYGEPTYTD